MVRTEAFEGIGRFDERFFMYGEDVDLSRRLTDAGWRLYYLSEAEIIHLAGAASKESGSQFSTLMTCESISKLMKKYYGQRGKVAYRLLVLFGSMFRLIVIGALLSIKRCILRTTTAKQDNSARKYSAMLQWSLGLRKPRIVE
jgi:N-acetylglucosaminyl-diphospho-decaprenol L-rhamnosyltransferase